MTDDSTQEPPSYISVFFVAFVFWAILFILVAIVLAIFTPLYFRFTFMCAIGTSALIGAMAIKLQRNQNEAERRQTEKAVAELDLLSVTRENEEAEERHKIYKLENTFTQESKERARQHREEIAKLRGTRTNEIAALERELQRYKEIPSEEPDEQD